MDAENQVVKYQQKGVLTQDLIFLRCRADDLSSITKLNLWGLKLHDVSILRSIPYLKIISMSSNHLTSLEPFSHCLQLEELYLRSNNISDLNEVGHLKYLPNLMKLWLDNNPCSKNSNNEETSVDLYRYSVIRNLNTLVHLDHKIITSAERAQSLEYGYLLTAPPQVTVTDTGDFENFTDADSISLSSTLVSDIDMDRTETDLDKSLTITEVKPLNGFKDELPTEKCNPMDIPDNVGTELVESMAVIEYNPTDLHDVTLKETNKIRLQCGLKPISKSKISSPVRKTQTSDQRHERIVRNAVMRLLRTLNSQSLETVILFAERRLMQLNGYAPAGRTTHQPEDNWYSNSIYDHTNYTDKKGI